MMPGNLAVLSSLLTPSWFQVAPKKVIDLFGVKEDFLKFTFHFALVSFSIRTSIRTRNGYGGISSICPHTHCVYVRINLVIWLRHICGKGNSW